jgi:uncharacterized phage-like protein YoqJ
MQMKYFTKDKNNELKEIPEKIANDVIRQYIEKRYTWVVATGLFIIGFLLGVIASG